MNETAEVRGLRRNLDTSKIITVNYSDLSIGILGKKEEAK